VPLQETVKGVDVASVGSELTAEDGGVVSTDEPLSFEHANPRQTGINRTKTSLRIAALL
jgi:hypothetical protein